VVSDTRLIAFFNPDVRLISLLVVPLAIAGALLPLDFILHAAQQVLALCMVGLHWLADAPFAVWQQAAAPAWTMALGVLGVLWLLLPRGFPQRWLGLILILPMLFVTPVELAEGEMQVTVLDVGQGLSVVVKTAHHVMLYDTGPQYNQEKNAGSSIVLPYLRSQGITSLDSMVVSHDDNDHSGGAAALLNAMPVSTLLSSYPLSASQLISAQQKCYAGQSWVWDGVHFEVLYPDADSYLDTEEKDNNRSCVIKVTSQYGAILLTGDIESSAEDSLLESQQARLKSDVMVAPHHGSKTSSSLDLINAVAAKQLVFTAGYLNRFKHPNASVVHRYQESGATLYRSDYNGAVIISFTQQEPLQVNAWRLSHRRYWHADFL